MIQSLKFFRFFFLLLLNPVFGQLPGRDLPGIKHLSEALQFETASHSTTSNESLIPFRDFVGWIGKTYPLINTKLHLDIINNYSLVYTWKGRDTSLPPGLITAHYDVVPADGLKDKWEKPPFNGDIDEEFIWGRGALDNKSQVIAILESLELLIKGNFQPNRSLYFAFGHDEETGGEKGAGFMNDFFLKQGLRFDFILDEGGALMTNVMPELSRTVAFIGIAEKGYLDLELRTEESGGHSSVPPRENAIDILARAITRINDNPMPARLDPVTIQMLKALAPYLDFKMRMGIKHRWLFKKKILKKLQAQPATNSLIRTIITPTIVQGGMIKNVLPQFAVANFNARLLYPDSAESVLAYLEKIIKDDRVKISLKRPYYNATPTTSTKSAIWKLVDSTVISVFPGVIVTPFLFPATTDSHHYLSLTSSIIRFNPIAIDETNKSCIHGIDERISIAQYMKSIEFYKTLIGSM